MAAPFPIAMIVPQSDYDALLGSLYAHTTVRMDEIARGLRISSSQEKFGCIRFFISEANARRVVAEIAETVESRACLRFLKQRLAEIDEERRDADDMAALAEERAAPGREAA